MLMNKDKLLFKFFIFKLFIFKCLNYIMCKFMLVFKRNALDQGFLTF